MSSQPLEIKVCIVGDPAVGKTSLSSRFCHGEFTPNSTSTIGASFLQKRVQCEGVEVNLQIWDTAGQERFRSMAPMYYRGAKAAICVFDVTNKESFERVVSWLKDLKNHADPNVVLCLAGNKCDRTPTFDLQECQEYADSVGAAFFETSALSGQNVDVIFNTLTKKICEVFNNNRRKSALDSNSNSNSTKVLGDKNGNTTTDTPPCC